MTEYFISLIGLRGRLNEDALTVFSYTQGYFKDALP